MVGAWLSAKNYFYMGGLAFATIHRDWTISGDLKTHLQSERFRNILLVDDESQSGNTILKKLIEFQNEFPQKNVKAAVIVLREDSLNKLRHENMINHLIYCYSDVPNTDNVRWPWET